jgi:hypothetical protein
MDNPRTYRDGMCYGSGMSANSHNERVTCPECNRGCGLNGSRIANHKPPDPYKITRDRIFKRMAARIAVQDWIFSERKQYADIKYSDDTESRHKLILETQNYGLDGEWMVFLGNYLKRAELFGLDTPKGRQALGKAIVTMIHALETAVEYLGPMPEPGHSSSDELEIWRR